MEIMESRNCVLCNHESVLVVCYFNKHMVYNNLPGNFYGEMTKSNLLKQQLFM